MERTPINPTRLAHFPISFFAVVMGLAGLTIAWEKAQHVFAVDLHINSWTLGTTTLVFLGLFALYLSKLLRHRDAVLREIKHPIKLNFFPTISISLLLLSIAFLDFDTSLSKPLWALGTLLHLGFTLFVINIWMHHEQFEVHHLNPAWFIPAVGNVLVPVAGVSHGYVEISWFFFSTGILFWAVLMAILFNRILFHNPIDQKLLPTLFILIAPPAVGFIAYSKLNGDLDTFARLLYYAGLFLTLLLFTQARRFLKLGFFLSWWAYSFPLAAITIASLLMFEKTGIAAYQWIGGGLLVLLTAIVFLLIARTGTAIRNRRICQPES